MSFDLRWENKKDPSALGKIKNTIKPWDPLKSRLYDSIKLIELENKRLEQASVRFKDRDKMIFNKVINAYSKHDTYRANIYANELVEIRKIEKMLFHAKLALEQIVLRMNTVSEIGDIAITLLPVVNVMNDIKSGIALINPHTEKELGAICDLLSGMVIEAGAVTGMTIDFEKVNEDSSKIVEEAQTIAESRMIETFPELPEAKEGQRASSVFDTHAN